MSKILVDGKDQNKERGLISRALGVLFGWVHLEKVVDKKGVFIVDKKQYKIEATNDINKCSREIHSEGGQVLVARAVTPLGAKETLSEVEIKRRLKSISKTNNKDLITLEEEAVTKEKKAVERADEAAKEASRVSREVKEETAAVKELGKLAALQAKKKGDK